MNGKPKPVMVSAFYSTPSENLCSCFCNLDTKEFGLVDGVTEKGYYTNSYHLDVEKKVDHTYAKLNFEMAYPPIANGGFICYGEYPNIQHNLEALENVWDYSYSRVPYYGTNTPIDGVMNAVIPPVSLIVPAGALPARNAAITIRPKSR